MSAASNYLENKVLDHVLRYSTAPYTAPTTLYVGLFGNVGGITSANLEAGTLTDEVTTAGNTAYARKSVTFGAASSGTSTSNSTVTFDAATASWGTVTHIAVLDNATAAAGNVLFYGSLTVSKAVASGDTFQVSSGNMSVSLA